MIPKHTNEISADCENCFKEISTLLESGQYREKPHGGE